MNVLVINCGSSTLKLSLVGSGGVHLADARVERIADGDSDAVLRVGRDSSDVQATDHAEALVLALAALREQSGDARIDAVGHRVVHGGERFVRPTMLNDAVRAGLADVVPLAPLHNPANIAGIDAAQAHFPDLPHVAVFDTAFHATLPHRAQTYALPAELTEKHGLRRYGFHGISHRFVAHRAAEHLGEDVRDLRIITCHLGNGCSCCAVEYGRSVETSMGMTPLEGLVMGTRSGDVDPGILVHIMRAEGLDADGLDELLNRESGLAGLSGAGNDMRDIEARASEGDERARRAIQVFAHRLKRYIGAYAAVMGGVDAIVFTGGIGENSATVRHRVAQRLDFLGARFDEDKNRAVHVSNDQPVAMLSASHSRVHLMAVATDEAAAIAEDTARIVGSHHQVRGQKTIPVAISARHVHLTQETVEKLFGQGHTLTERNPLSQPGQFACEETVTLVGPKRTIEKVRILGPTRSKNQVEVSRTDEFTLGLDAPVRASGDVKNTPGIRLVGPEGTVDLQQGVICAWRHIHMTPQDAEDFGVQDRDVVQVAINGSDRDLIFGDVLVRVSPKYKLEMHIDTDEGNAANLSRGAVGVLADVGSASILERQARWDRVED